MTQRIVALDSLRGIAACLIALFHFPAELPSHLLTAARIDNIWLYTDFFFVLSGFVIAARYQERLRQGMPALRFLLLRFGRLYPLHLAVLGAFVLRSVLLAIALAAGESSVQPQFQQDDIVRILAYLGLLQGLPQLQSGAWNSPSWSISGEFWAYVVFAGVLMLCARRAVPVLAGLALVGSAAFWLLMLPLGADYLEVYIEFGALRCLHAFFTGAVAWNIQRCLRIRVHSVHEVFFVALVLVWVALSRETGVLLAGPYLCAALVLVFAREAGPLSRLLRTGPMRFLGPLSYSIYMIHMLLNQALWDLFRIAGRLFNFEVNQNAPLTGSALTGDALVLAYLLALVAIATLTHRWIEVPARDWFRRRAGQPA